MIAIPFITSLLARRFSAKIAEMLSGLITIGLLAIIVWLLYSWAWDRGRDHQRALNDAEVAEIRKERDDAAAALGKRDAAEADAVEANISQNRKELDDATAKIPDRALSDRQRARACRELVRQGKRCPPLAPAPAASGD